GKGRENRTTQGIKMITINETLHRTEIEFRRWAGRLSDELADLAESGKASIYFSTTGAVVQAAARIDRLCGEYAALSAISYTEPEEIARAEVEAPIAGDPGPAP